MVVFVNLQPSEESEYKGKQCYDLGRFRADVQDSDDILAYLWNSDNDTATTNLTSLRYLVKKVANLIYSIYITGHRNAPNNKSVYVSNASTRSSYYTERFPTCLILMIDVMLPKRPPHPRQKHP